MASGKQLLIAMTDSIRGFIEYGGVQESETGGRSQESNLPGTAGGTHWI